MSHLYLVTNESISQQAEQVSYSTEPENEPNDQRYALKFYKRLNIYKGNNVSFNPATCRAYSYDWWLFVTRIDNKVVFNKYYYSAMTNKHQWKIKVLLSQLNIKIDHFIECPNGLQDLDSGINHYKHLIAELQAGIDKPKSRKKTNHERMQMQEEYREKIKIIRKLMANQNKQNRKAN